MPRPIVTGLRTLADTGDVTSHSALKITLNTGQIIRMATDQILVGVEQYLPNLRKGSVLRLSRRRVLDGVEVEAQNIDRALGLSFAATATALDNAKAVFSKIYVAGDGTKYQKNLLQGSLVAAQLSDMLVECKVVSDMNTGGAVASWRTMPKNCQWRFKDPLTCGAVTAATVCTKKLVGPNSCTTHGRRFRFSGFWFIEEPDGTVVLDPHERDGLDDDLGFDGRFRSRYSPHLNPWARRVMLNTI